MSKKSEKEKTKAAALAKKAQNLPTAPAPGQLPAPDAQGVWNPPPLRPMAKVAELPQTGPKVDWNGVPREPGDEAPVTDALARVKKAHREALEAQVPLGSPTEPVVTNNVTPTRMEMPVEVPKYGPLTGTKTVTKRVPNKGAKYPDPKKPEKPPRKIRNPGVYEVFMHGRVQGSVSVGQSGILEIMIPQAGVYNTREDAEFAARAAAAGNPGKTVEVHRRLSRMTFEATTTTKLVRN